MLNTTQGDDLQLDVDATVEVIRIPQTTKATCKTTQLRLEFAEAGRELVHGGGATAGGGVLCAEAQRPFLPSGPQVEFALVQFVLLLSLSCRIVDKRRCAADAAAPELQYFAQIRSSEGRTRYCQECSV